MPEGRGNDGRMESRGKPKTGFPPLSTGLGNRYRDSHIPTAPNPILLNGKENPRTKGPTTLSSGSFFDENMLIRSLLTCCSRPKLSRLRTELKELPDNCCVEIPETARDR